MSVETSDLTQEEHHCIAGAVFTINGYRRISQRGYKTDIRVGSYGVALESVMGTLFTDFYRGTAYLTRRTPRTSANIRGRGTIRFPVKS